MKKVFTLVSIIMLLAISIRSNAQCTPNTSQTAFLVPDTATNFAPAFTFMPYEQVLYIAVPTDTTVVGIPATIDSLVLIDVTGAPASISYSANPAGLVFPGGSHACIQFTGTPTQAEIGSYPLTINSKVYTSLTPTGMSVPLYGYTIKVLDSASYGIYHPDHHYEFSVFQNSPNPFNDITEIAFQSPGKEKITVQVYNICGQLLFSKTLVSVQGYNAVLFDGTEYPEGLYIYKVSNGELTVSKRMSLTK